MVLYKRKVSATYEKCTSGHIKWAQQFRRWNSYNIMVTSLTYNL